MGALLLIAGGVAAYFFWPRETSNAQPATDESLPSWESETDMLARLKKEKGEIPPLLLLPDPGPEILYNPFANTTKSGDNLLLPKGMLDTIAPPDLPGYLPVTDAGDFWFYQRIDLQIVPEPVSEPLVWISQPGFLAAESVIPVFEPPPFLLEYFTFDWPDGAIWMLTPEGSKLGIYGGQAFKVVIYWHNNFNDTVTQRIKLRAFNTGWTPDEQELTLGPKAKGQTVHFLVMPISKTMYSAPLLVSQGMRDPVVLDKPIWVSPAPPNEYIQPRPEAVSLD